MDGILSLKDICGGTQAAVILANGPGLKDVDLNELSAPGYGHITIGLNRIYKDFTPDYLVCVNDLVLEQWGDEILAADCIKVLPRWWVKQKGVSDSRVISIDTSLRQAHFEENLTKPIWEGHTVTYVAMQLARWMGAYHIKLVGLDHYFGELEGAPNQEVIQTQEDEAHYRSDYFPKGSRWNLPDLKASEMAYLLAADKIPIHNFSTQTRWRGFPLLPPNQVYGIVPIKVSAIVSAYRSRKFFKECLADLMAQSLWGTKYMEIVVVCKRGSYEWKVIQEYKDHHMVQIVETKDTPNVYQAWNMGIKASSGKYITNANTDDRHHKQSFEILAAALDAMPHIDLVYHNQFITWKPNQTYNQFIINYPPSELVGGREKDKPGVFAWPEYDRELLTKGCYIGAQPMWRASVHQLHGYFDEQFESAGDWDFWLRIAKQDNFYHLNATLGLYLANPKGIELSDKKRAAKEAQLVMDLHQEANIEVKVQSKDLVRIQLGDRYIQTNIDGLQKLVNHIMTQHLAVTQHIPSEDPWEDVRKVMEETEVK